MDNHVASEGVHFEGRVVPLPRHVSAQALAHLKALYAARHCPAYPAIEDSAAWEAVKSQVNAQMDGMLAAEENSFKASCETVEIDGVTIQLATPQNGPNREDCALLDMHGGALIFCEGPFCIASARRQADSFGVRVYSVDYRNPPAHPYPAALDDCVTAYRALLRRYAPCNIIIGGLSAGGNLAAATILRARDEGLPLPAAALLLSPEVDLTESGDSFTMTDGLDGTYPSSLMQINLLYAAGHDLEHPYVSPLFGDFTRGFPPTFLHAGTRDFFLSNAALLHRKLRRAQIPAELHVFEGMPHGGFGGTAPEDIDLANEVRRFVASHWGSPAEPVSDSAAKTLIA